MLNQIMYFVVFSSKTAFFKFEDIFPECFLYREKTPQIEPLMCLEEDNACHVGKNCMEMLAKRLLVLFKEVINNSDLMVLYFKKRGIQGIGAGVFWKDFRSPRTITVNPFAWDKIKSTGKIFQFMPESEFFIFGRSKEPELKEQATKSEL